MSIATDRQLATRPLTNDWHYSWMFTGQQNNIGQRLDLRRQYRDLREPAVRHRRARRGPQCRRRQLPGYQVDGETVVEAIWGYSANIASGAAWRRGFGISADRAVLFAGTRAQPDPVVNVGDWIADVTYERNASTVVQTPVPELRAIPGRTATGSTGGLQNPYNNVEWDNLPAQRCFWYRVQKVMAADRRPDISQRRPHAVDGRLCRSDAAGPDALNARGHAGYVNAALICPRSST